jgi:PAS domain S-box-containing protein
MTDHAAIQEPDLLDLMQESVVVRGLDGSVIRWNAASERLYGWSEAEAKGRPMQDLLRPVGEPDARSDQKLHETGTWDGEVVRTTAAGLHVRVTVKWHVRRDGQGAPAGIVETALPIVPRQYADRGSAEAERRYRTLFDFVPVALIQLDRTLLADVFETLKSQGVQDLGAHLDLNPDFAKMAMDSIQVVEVNRRAVELFGAKDAAELLGSVTPLWSESPEVFCQSMQARFRGASRFEAEIRIRTRDGRVLHALYMTDFPEALRVAALGLACLIDIEDRVKAQAMLSQMQSDLAHAARVSMLGELTASIAHEVNQPLGAILTSGEAALRWLDRSEVDIEELRALSHRTVADARRAADIISRIRAMASRATPEQAPTDINAVVEAVMVFLNAELRRQMVDVVLDLSPGLPDVLADRVQLQQVFVNLAVNAMQAMEAVDTPKRYLTIRTMLAKPDMLCTQIEDTGPGIAPGSIGRVFESFFTTKDRGMGIGLAICRSIIEEHGGSIHAANVPDGRGAGFRFLLPVYRSGRGQTGADV